MLFHNSLLSSSIILFFVVFYFLIYQQSRADDNCKSDADAEEASPRSIITERSVDIAYASYITKISDSGTVTPSTAEESKLTDNNESALVDITDTSNTQIQQNAIQPVSRCSTLRAAAAPFQPAALDAKGRSKDRTGLSLSQSNRDLDSDRNNAQEVVLLGSAVRAAPAPVPIAILPAAVTVPVTTAVPKEVVHSRVISADTALSLPGGVTGFHGVHGIHAQRIAPGSTVPATTTAAVPLQLMSRQKLNSVSTSLHLSSSTSSQKSTGSKGKLSHSTVNSSTVNTATASASTELWHKKETNKSFFYESEKSENSRMNGNHERRYSGGSNRGNGSGSEDWDAAMEAEVTEASEHVWRQVEKWIEAEAMAEEAAWNVLVLGHDNEDEERYLGEESDCTEEDFSSKPPDTEVESVLSPLELTSEQSNKHNIHRVQHGADHTLSLNNNNSSSSSSAVPAESHRSRISAFSTDKLLSNNTSSSSSAAVSTTHTPSTTTMTPSMYSCSTVTYESPRSSSPAADWNITGSNKCLHAKLSAPDRRRAVSPTEVRRKQEAKQHSAESNRDRTVAERRQRALLVSDRAKIRGINEQKRLNLAESALEERLRDAEKRHEECIKVIKLRAGNENTKVSEVMFINNMNAEGIVDQLRQKLVEVEARVLAAVMRRQDILTGITARQRKRNNRKVQQMSELRLQLERQKMERWDKLQRRLEAVQVRRQARFQEMQRRSDAQELTRARLASTYYLSKERDKESIDFNSVKSFGVSLSSIASTINSFKAQLTSPLSNSGTLDLGNSTLVSAAVEAATMSEKSKDKQKQKQKEKDKDKEKEKEKERFASAVVTALSAASPVSIPASVPVPLCHTLPLPGPLPLPASLPTSLPTSVPVPVPALLPATATAVNPLRSRISNNSSNNSSISPSASASASDNATKSTAPTPTPTLTPTSSSIPLKVTDTVSRVKSKHGIKAAVVPSRPVRSSSRPFITSLKSPSVSGCAGFFESSTASSSAKVTVTGKSSAGILRSNSGSSTNNNNNNTTSNNNNNSNSNNSNSNGIDVSTVDGVKGTVLNLNRSHKPVTALSTKTQHEEVHTCEYNELSELDNLSLTPTELLQPHTTEEKCMNKSKNSNSVCDGDVEVISTETEMTNLGGVGAGAGVGGGVGVQGSVVKKKKKGKKKDKGVEKDEEMTILNSLLHAKEQLKDSEMKNTVCAVTGVSNDEINKNVNTLLGVVHMITDVTSRPRLFKHLNAFAKSLKKKQGLKICRDQSTGHFSGLYDAYLTLTKLNSKIKDTGSSENENENENENSYRNENENENDKDVNVHYTPASTVHNLVTFMCKNIDALLLGQAPSGKSEGYTILKAAISFDVSEVLGKLESGLDLKKEIGLFLKRGGNVLLRILLGDEIGLLSNSGCCILGSVDEVASSGLLPRICRAVNACNLTERAREFSFSAGINYMVSDLTLVFSSHLTDWLAAQQWCYISEGQNKRLILSNECQSIPLLLSALTCQLNRSASTISSPDIEPSRKTQHYTFIRYIFASGMASSLCRAVRSLAPLHSYASEDVFIYLLLYSVLECLDALCLCVWGMEKKTSTIPIIQVINLTNVESTPTPTSTSTSTSTTQCDAKSCSVLVPFSRKDMVCTLQDMHTAPTLVCMLER